MDNMKVHIKDDVNNDIITTSKKTIYFEIIQTEIPCKAGRQHQHVSFVQETFTPGTI